MSRILSEAQKKEIFKNIPSSFTIGSTDINASKIWSNQEITSYPTISLNISNDGVPSDIQDLECGVIYYQSILTIHVLTRHANGMNGVIIADALSNDIIKEMESWTTPLTGDIRIFDTSDIKSLQNLGRHESADVFDFIISTTLYHS